MKKTSKNTWESLQDNHIAYLIQIILHLKEKPFANKSPTSSGNYLIYKEEKPFYIGEAKDIKNRLKDHSKMDVNSKVKYFETNLGRKEIEAFGIANIPTPENKAKKNDFSKIEDFEMNFSLKEFDEISYCLKDYEELLKEGMKEFESQSKNDFSNIKDLKNTRGVYGFFDNEDMLIYIGETSTLKTRLNTHFRQTTFSAFRRSLGKRFGFELKRKPKKSGDGDTKKGDFTEKENQEITDYLKKCTFRYLKVHFARAELEELLIKKLDPLLNIKR